MRPKGTKEELEARRRRAVAMLEAGQGVREVARIVGVYPGSVSRWKKMVETGGPEALKARPPPGRQPRLSRAQMRRLPALLKRGPRAWGYKTDLWTLKRVAGVIEKHFAVRYHPSHVWRILRALRWSCQKPERRARERDEDTIRRWRRVEWPRIKKARREGRSLVFVDESGFMLQPVVRRTWAPQGRTPIHYSWDRHDRLSALSALTVSPLRRRLGLYFRLQEENVRGEGAAEFLVQVRRALGRPLLVVWDRWSVHRKASRLLAPRLGEGIDFEWFPPYAPELNPTEQVWTHTKYADLANFIPEDVEHLRLEVAASITDQRSTPSLLRSFFVHAKLGL